MSEVASRINNLPGWTPYRQELTKQHGPLRFKSMFPVHQDFWAGWKNPVLRDELKKAGYSINKLPDGRWMGFHWTEWISPKNKTNLIQESRASDADVNLMIPAGKSYLGYQRSGIKYCIDRLFGQNGQPKRKGVLIGDDMGLGKTIQALGILNQDFNLHRLKVLVICPASLKINWKNEAKKFLIDGMGSNAAVVKGKWPDQFTNIYIVNYDVLGKWHDQIREIEWDYVIVDEAQYMKNEMARRTAFAIGGVVNAPKKPGQDEPDKLIIAPIPANRWVFLSGTPMENGRAMEMWPIITTCDPTGMGASKVKFASRYGKSDDHFEELQEILRATIMVRRMKADVLTELPPKVRSVVSLDPKDWGVEAIFAEEMRIFKEYQEALKTWNIATEIAKLGGADHYKEIIKSKKMKLGMSIGQISKMRKNGAIAKVPAFVDQVKEAIAQKKRPLIFAHHIEVLDLLQEAFEKMGLRVGRIDGNVPPNRRQAIVDAFQKGELDIFLGGIIPAGVGLTLTSSDWVMFIELDWIPGRLTQCEDRAHRIGQLDVVFVQHVVMEGSLDELMAKRLVEKQERIERALDSQAVAEDDLEEDEKAEPMLALPNSRPSSKGYSPEALHEDAEKMSEHMREVAYQFVRDVATSLLAGFEEVDVVVCQKMLERGLGGPEAALGRKIAMRNKDLISPEIFEQLEFKRKEAA